LALLKDFTEFGIFIYNYILKFKNVYKINMAESKDPDLEFCNGLISILQKLPFKADLTFNILNKNSASPSLIIVAKGLNRPVIGDEKDDSIKGCPRTKGSIRNSEFAIKTWCRTDTDADSANRREPAEEEEALGYEKRVYINKIKPILDANPEGNGVDGVYRYMPLLKYLGDDNDCCKVDTIAEFIGIEKENDMMIAQKNLLYLAFYSIDAMIRDDALFDRIKPCNYMDSDFYIKFFKKIGEPGRRDLHQRFQTIGTWNIGAILLPNTTFKPYTEYIGSGHQALLFKEIIKGTYTINKANLVHNDLHSNNIMVQMGNPPGSPLRRIMIYDWDRGYSPQLGPNVLLNDDPRFDLCKSSQCNLFMGQRPIDLLKILRYLADDKNNLFDVLQNALGLEDNPNVDGVNSRFQAIYYGLRFCSVNNKFFIYNYGSSLYKVNHCARLETAIALLGGGWDIIYNNVFPGVEINIGAANVIEGAGMAIKRQKGQVIPAYMTPLVNLFMTIVNNKCGRNVFSEVRADNIELGSNELKSFEHIYTDKKIPKFAFGDSSMLSSSSSDIVKPSKSGDTISSVMRQLRLDPDDQDIINECLNISAEKFDWVEFNVLRKLVDRIKFGIPKMFRPIVLKDDVELYPERENWGERELASIMAENEDRKGKIVTKMRKSRILRRKKEKRQGIRQ
jgi:hypothetical protein